MRDAHLSSQRKVHNAEKAKQKKEEERVARERRDEKERRERGWEELYGEERVREEGRANDGGGRGWDEDDFM